MKDQLQFMLNRFAERLWIKPLAACVLSIGAAFLARLADQTGLHQLVVEVTPESVIALLQIISSSMLVIATFAVASMVAAYASASSTATPRSFALIISDDVSQNALSTFIGAFIFSIVALIAIKNGFYEKAGLFFLFVLTLSVFALVIVTFVRWVDRIARLGRLGSTIEKVEAAATSALERRRIAPTMGGVLAQTPDEGDRAVYGDSIGYVQRVDIAALQAAAEVNGFHVIVSAIPGTFTAPGRALAYVIANSDSVPDVDTSSIKTAFHIGNGRTFDEDPRFGLIVLSEIACRALSSAVNDPGTAINVIGSLVRLFSIWCKPVNQDEMNNVVPDYPLVGVPELSLEDMLNDSFRAIARDGAGTLEVGVRLQKAFESLTLMGDTSVRHAVMRHARFALARAEKALDSPEDLTELRNAGRFATTERD